MEETLGDYKHYSLRKIISKKIDQQQSTLDMKEVTDVLDCDAMWKEYAKAIKQVKRCKDVPGQVLNCCTIAVATLLCTRADSDQGLSATVQWGSTVRLDLC